MAGFDPTVWLLVAFIIFFAATLKKLSSVTMSAIHKYKALVTDSIELAEKQKLSSIIELERMRKKTDEVESVCRKIINTAILEGERMESKMKIQIASYLHFKEHSIEEKIKIFNRVQVENMKKSVICGAIDIVTTYLKESSKNEAPNFGAQINTILPNLEQKI